MILELCLNCSSQDKGMLGMFILFLAVWVCSNIYLIIKLITRKIQYIDFFNFYINKDYPIIGFVNVIVTFIGILLVIFLISMLIGSFL